jgi:hypothetical protein
MEKKGNRLHIFWGAALGIVLSEPALAQLAAATTPEERAALVLRMAESGEISPVAVTTDGKQDSISVVKQDFDKDNWSDVVAWDKADPDPYDKDTGSPA